jgi:alginate O-acetyltransferase complex protein AlgI
MLFNSLEFALFFPVVTALYFALPHRARWLMLLAASCYFYMAFVPVYILILGFTIVIDYFAGILIENSQGQRRRLFLIASLIANVGILCVFKYYNWLNGALGEPLPVLAILLPIGLSFHTFQAMSYTIEVYRGHQRAERHFGLYALYVMFYPQLVAGPIERPQNLLPQFHRDHNDGHAFDYDRVVSGLRIMMGGFLMKLGVADQVAPFVFQVWGQPGVYHGWPVIIANVFFIVQMYCDFAGYSLIAIGSAKVMGYTLMWNFDRPWFSTSLNEFWRRWHISLMTWFRDYLFLPLAGGNRFTKRRGLIALFIVYVVSGVWHGANWTFLLWGVGHGVAIVFGNLTRKWRNKRWKGLADWEAALRTRSGDRQVAPVQAAGVPRLRVPLLVPKLQSVSGWFFMFLVYYFLGGLFAVRTLSEWPVILVTQFQFGQSELGAFILSVGPYRFILAVLSIAALVAVEFFQGRHKLDEWIAARPGPVRWALYLGCFVFILLFAATGGESFIYFQF